MRITLLIETGRSNETILHILRYGNVSWKTKNNLSLVLQAPDKIGGWGIQTTKLILHHFSEKCKSLPFCRFKVSNDFSVRCIPYPQPDAVFLCLLRESGLSFRSAGPCKPSDSVRHPDFPLTAVPPCFIIKEYTT